MFETLRVKIKSCSPNEETTLVFLCLLKRAEAYHRAAIYRSLDMKN